jgi:actin-related protein 8
LASEAFPISVPHVISRRFSTITPSTDEIMEEESEEIEEKYDVALREIRGELKWRMKNAKRRAVPNAEGQVIGFNTSGFKETILDHNDPYKVEWTDVSKETEYFVGEKVRGHSMVILLYS